METKFQKYTVQDFNLITDCKINKDMSFQEFIDEIDSGEVSYFYVSLNNADVLNAIEYEIEVAKMLNLRLIYVYELGVYIATY
jgi:hypothetical protein